MYNVMNNIAYFLRKKQTQRMNTSIIVTIKNAKFSGYYLYVLELTDIAGLKS